MSADAVWQGVQETGHRNPGGAFAAGESRATAAGRVERLNGVHQDRLVKEFQLAGITDLNKANDFLRETYLDGHNKRFAVTAKSRIDFHRPVPKELDLRTVFCIEEERHVNNDWTVRFNNRYFQILKENDRLPRPGDKLTISEWLRWLDSFAIQGWHTPAPGPSRTARETDAAESAPVAA